MPIDKVLVVIIVVDSAIFSPSVVYFIQLIKVYFRKVVNVHPNILKMAQVLRVSAHAKQNEKAVQFPPIFELLLQFGVDVIFELVNSAVTLLEVDGIENLRAKVLIVPKLCLKLLVVTIIFVKIPFGF